MTGRELIQILYENVTFPPATANKRFVGDMAARPKDYVLSERAERYAWRIAYFFRRQLPKDVAAEAVRRKVDHDWIGDPGEGDTWYRGLMCAVCGQKMYSRREANAPCPGPPEPKPLKKERKRKVAPIAEAPSAAPQESLFKTEAVEL